MPIEGGAASAGSATRHFSEPSAQICYCAGCCHPAAGYVLIIILILCWQKDTLREDFLWGAIQISRLLAQGFSAHMKNILVFPQTVLCTVLTLLLVGPMICFPSSSIPPEMEDLHRRGSLQRAKPAYPSKHRLVLVPGVPHWLLGHRQALNRSFKLT